MVYIKKNKEPRSLTEFRLSTPNASYDGLPTDIKNDIRNTLLDEQGFICAYCMRQIDMDGTFIEHYIPRNLNGGGNELELDYRNFLGVCSGNKGSPFSMQTCDRHRKNKKLKINPLVQSSVDMVRYTTDGYIGSADSEINSDLNETLNLNYSTLVENRKSALNALKKALKKQKRTGSWENLARRYIDKLNGGSKKQQYCGILLWYLNTKVSR